MGRSWRVRHAPRFHQILIQYLDPAVAAPVQTYTSVCARLTDVAVSYLLPSSGYCSHCGSPVENA